MSGCPYCGHDKFKIKITMSGGAAADPAIECEKCGRKLRPDQIRKEEPAPAPAPAPAATAPKPSEPIPERERSDVLLAMATPDLYRHNPFRVTGLRVTATQREMARQADKLKMFEKLGTPPAAASLGLPLDPPPNIETIREAMERLRDPEKRLVDELFWIWPMPGANDDALDYFNSGHVAKAADMWRREEDGPNRDVARHNLAVLQHARLIESDSASEKEWKESLAHWLKLVNEGVFWSRIATRIAELDDPRLTTGTARRLRLTLPLALLSFNATLAVQAAERGDFDRAKRQRDIVLSSGFPQEAIDEALSSAVTSVRDRLQTLCKAADAESDADPEHADKIVERLIEQTRPLRQVIIAVLPAGNPTRIGALDEVALKALGCQIVFGNKTEQWPVCADLLKKILEIAFSESARSRIQQSIDTVNKNIEVSTCWFCGDGRAVTEASAEVKMYGNVQRTPTWQGTRVTWNYGTVPVPRCANCKKVHKSSGDKPFALGCLGSLIGIGSCIAMAQNAHGDPFPVIIGLLFIIISIVGGVIWNKSLLGGIKSESAKNQHPVVLEKRKNGWMFGERPA